MALDQRFLELLPWYVNGTLGPDDRRWMDDELRRDPAAAAELAWFRSLDEKIRADAPRVSDEVGLARTLARIQREGPPPLAVRPRRPAGSTGWLEALRSWFGGWQLTPALGVALAVIVLQSGLLVRQAVSDREAAEVRTLEARPTVDGQLLRIAFKPTATEADLRLLLIRWQGNIESGPGQLGDYYVRVPAARVAEATAALKASPLVEDLQTVDAVPARGQ